MIYVYTCILSGFDNLRPPAVTPEDGVRWICYTNVPNLPRVHPWEYRPAYQPNGDASRASRVPKILPHLMLPADADYSIYHDGNFRLRVSPHEIVNSLLSERDWAVCAHPGRECIYDEARVLLLDPGMEGWRQQKPERAEAVRMEIGRYREQKYPAGNGLWANGFIVRRHTVGVRDLNEAWWQLYAAGSERDQLSFPVARHNRDFPVHTITGNIYQSPYLQFCWHAAWRDSEDNPDFWAERERTRERLGRLAELAGAAPGVKFVEY